MTPKRDVVISELRHLVAAAAEPYIMGGMTEEQLLQSVALIPEECDGKVSLRLKNQSHEIISAIRYFQTNDARVMDDPHAENIPVATTDPVTGKLLSSISRETAWDRGPVKEINRQAAYIFGMVTAAGRTASSSLDITSTPKTITADSWDTLAQALRQIGTEQRRGL